MRIVFAGTPEFAVPSLQALAAAGHEVVGVITREDAPLGRKRVLTPSPVAVAAEALGLPILKANRLDDAATVWVAERAPELGVIVAYGGLVREPLLSLPEHGWINLHFSELPRWRGAAPVQRALEAGEQTLGVTVFRLVAALDAGDVLTRDSRAFPPGTSAGAALAELSEFGTDAVLAAVQVLASDPAAGEPQAGAETYAHKLTREDGRLDLTRPADAVLAHWAGVTPEPGAYVTHEEQPIKLLELAPRGETDDTRAPGTVTLTDGVVVLATGSGTLELRRVQPAGKPGMDAAAWLRGRGGQAVLA
ncbi:methionyl-tRNA formyltransferase [Leucobacter chromiireducens]|uniref:Methionyl-tRNA formyltransferase n=1 Tax=Leucobacter chromiireducens subsp. solipictus TaxID=398235 RepID=A0ABS1SE24_9MICO|nr:methionyl-tRNA formyltransferase [Leucobacter chromiireducens]MBL3677759.1 methionyl-tRNA formyltransferase [Leucobacter chromiireducens subsp. solipictus]